MKLNCKNILRNLFIKGNNPVLHIWWDPLLMQEPQVNVSSNFLIMSANSYTQNSCNSGMFIGFLTCSQNIFIGLRSGLPWPFQNINLILAIFWVTCVFRLIVLLHDPLSLEIQFTHRCPDTLKFAGIILKLLFHQLSWLGYSKQTQQIQAVLCFTDGMKFLCWNAVCFPLFSLEIMAFI